MFSASNEKTSFQGGMADPRALQLTALENEVNALCRRYGEAERYPVAGAAPAAQSPLTDRSGLLAEDALRASEAFNRSIIESSVDCIKVLDLEGNLLAMPNGQRILGMDCIQPFLNTSWIEFWKGDDRQAAQAAVTAAAAGETQSFVGFFRTLLDEPRWWDVVVSPIFNAAGKPARLLVISRDVTQRKQAEDALRQRTAQFETLLDEAPLGIFMVDADFRIRHVNPLALPVFGNISGLIGRDLTDVLHILWPKAKAEEMLGQFRQTMETGANFHVAEMMEMRADRQQVEYYEWQISRIQLPEGYGVVCYFRDISGRVRAQEKIRESEERFRALVTASSDVVYRMSPDWREMRQLDGRNFLADTAEPNAEWLRLYIHPDDQARVMAVVDEAIRTKSLFEMEHQVRRVDGSLGWTFSHAVPMLDAQGDIVEWFGTAKDVTESKRAEQALRESEDRYRTLFNSIDEGFCVIEMLFDGADRPVDYRFVEVNPSFEQQTGMIGATGKRMRELAPDHEASWFELYGKVALLGKPIRFENKASHLGNRWFDVYAFRIGAPDSRKVAILFTNITERKLAGQQLLEQADKLSDQDRRKDEFLAMLGHELRNPLAPIANAVHLLRLQKNESPVQRQARTVIERQVGQLNHLVDDLLEVSRISTGRVQLRREQLAIGGIVERAVESAQPLMTQRRHELTVALPPEPLWLHADASRLEQVIVNLLTNAAKYTDEGGRIALTVLRDGDAATLRVRDTGIGIAPELLPHIFELFTQDERSLDRSQGGLGIGLCLVQRLVELHGGTVAAQSVPGQGSEFVVRLPLAKVALPASAPHVADAAQPPGQPCRILVVDDNVDAAETLEMLLEASGHAVKLAHEGLGALQAALAWLPGVILLDIGLPGLNGYEVAKRIRLNDSLAGVVLIALTGYGQEADRQLSLQAGFDHHLVKPANFGALEKILDSVAAGQA